MTEDNHDENSCSRQQPLPLSWEIRRQRLTGSSGPSNSGQPAAAGGIGPKSAEASRPEKPRRQAVLSNRAAANPAGENRRPPEATADRSHRRASSSSGRSLDSSPLSTTLPVHGVDSEPMDKPAEKAGTNWAEDSGTGYFSTIQVPEFETSLGAVLRQKREARGMTINEVCQRTRIPPDFIKQLESDLYERLPPPVYTRSYIGQLCREYSLNPDLLLQAYDQAQSRRQTGDRGTQPLALVINNDREDGSISYTPIPSSHFPGDNAGWSAHLPRLAIMIATGLLLLLVFSAVVIQQYTNYRLRRGEEMEAPVSGQPAMTSQPATIDLEELVPAQRLPLQELSIPGA